MNNILLLIVRFGSLLTFLVLEFVCIFLVVNYNNSQRSIFLNSTSVYLNSWTENLNGYRRYFKLDEINDSLLVQNARFVQNSLKEKPIENDSFYQFSVIAGKVVSNTSNLRNNSIVINKGSKDGIKEGMGVIGEHGLVGIIKNVSRNYAQLNSLLHSQTRISSTVSPELFPGNLIWKNDDPKFMTLEAIPKYLKVQYGDTIITNGFSTIFPSGIVIGFVEEVKPVPGSDSHEIKVKLINDVSGTNIVYVLKNKDKAELDSLILLNNG